MSAGNASYYSPTVYSIEKKVGNPWSLYNVKNLVIASFLWQALDAEDLLTGNYTIDDVVLPLPG